ncbi:MAG TPA: Gfo/Idh/MocA family oxidoreductase [Solirubrobacteraceae bacterium]|nr:Gfo/Idh/MocA family oxidoreductase [Solirubrobacteraceae bacterium]
MIRWGLIGTGLISSAFAADLELTDSGTVAAVGSRRHATAEEFGERFGVPNRHDSYEALVADPEVDAVYVGTPHPMHHEDALLALRAGKHVLVEKPFTMNAAEAEELVATARDAGLFLMEAMWARFVPQMVEVRQLLAEGALGEVVTVIADHGQWFAEDRDFRLFAPELGGGALLDLGIYPVSFASMVLGTPDRVVSLADPAFTGVDAQTSILLGHPGGAHAVLTCTLAAKGPTQAAIIGTEARIEIEGPFYAPSAFTLTPREGEPQRSEPPHKGRGMLYEADEVARCIGEGLLESPVIPLDETVAIMRTMDQIAATA